MNLKKIIGIVSLVVAAALIIYGYLLYRQIFAGNTKFPEKEMYVHIPTNSTFDDVKHLMSVYIEDMERFESTAEKKSYPTNIKAGRFLLKKGMNSNEIVNALRQNIPVQLAFNNQERMEDFADRIASQLEPDSLSLMQVFTDENFLKENGFNEANALCMYIPNSYEFFWNVSAEKFRDRMAKEYRGFWNADRTAKAERLGLTPIEVYILASIVHKETVKVDERPRVAGVYLNRLKQGMKLEADPTVIYAMKKQADDFSLVVKRVLNKDLLTNSSYNTYMYEGLPPGPIAMPDISAIDAVLNPENHNYLYFCASVTNFGYHEFAVTLAQHNVNAQKYAAWINAQGIKR